MVQVVPDLLHEPYMSPLYAVAEIWAESNPLDTHSVGYLLRVVARLPAERKFLVGLDSEQVEGVEHTVLSAANGRLQVGEIRGCGRGYFKLRRGPPGDIVSAAGITGVQDRTDVGMSHQASISAWAKREGCPAAPI